MSDFTTYLIGVHFRSPRLFREWQAVFRSHVLLLSQVFVLTVQPENMENEA